MASKQLHNKYLSIQISQREELEVLHARDIKKKRKENIGLLSSHGGGAQDNRIMEEQLSWLSHCSSGV